MAKIAIKEFYLATRKRRELINITSQVQEAVVSSGVKEGLCIVHVPHATAGIIINEDEPGLKQDIESWIERTFPWDAEWKHNMIDNNAAAHVAASIIGNSRVIPISNGSLVRGTWQEIFLVELDGPRNMRKVVVTIIGE